MSKFQLTWRVSGNIWLKDNRWQEYLRLIDRHDDVCDEVALAFKDDMYPELAPLDDKRKQAEFFEKRAQDLRARGIKVGINVWPSLHLYPVERAYYPTMRRMVGIDGESIENLACPVSEAFMEHMRQKYIIFAKANPDFIWMDDDLRFTHMDGNYPCFCDQCVESFQNGAYKSRADLVAALGKPENRNLRIAWTTYGGDRLAKLCAHLRAAVDTVNPKIDIGLMTVGATHTTFSGDYIGKHMKAFRSRRGRPGHGFYSDQRPNEIMWKTLEAGRQILEYPATTTDIFWEEDSHPQTYLNKSNHTRRNEITQAITAGCNGVAFNHLSVNDGVDQKFAREVDDLHANRPRWEAYFRFAKDLPWLGAWPLYSWQFTGKADAASAWLKEDPFGERPNPSCDITLPEQIGPCGVALTADQAHASVTLLTGKTLTALEPEERKQIFSGNVYMDATALATLEELGHAEWAGVALEQSAFIGVGQDQPCFFTDHPFNGPFAGHRSLSVSTLAPKKSLRPLDESVEWLAAGTLPSATKREYLRTSKYQNKLGGKVVVNAFDAWEYNDQPHNLYQFASICKWFDMPIYLRYSNPNTVSRVQPYIRSNGKQAAVTLLNASFDTTYPFEVCVKGNMTNAVLLSPDGSTLSLESKREDDRLCVSIPEIAMWDIAVVLLY